MPLKEIDTIKAHVTPSGEVWFSERDLMPVRSEMCVAEFIRSCWMARAKAISIIAARSNIDLILRAAERAQQSFSLRLQICGPNIVSPKVLDTSPVGVLVSMRSCRLPSSCGGWHEFTEEEKPSYLLAEAFAAKASEEEITDLLIQHRCWRRLSLIRHLCPIRAAELLSIILDPRFYADPDAPDRCSRLNAFLGLSPDRRGRLGSEKLIRRVLVENCWRTNMDLDSEDHPSMFLRRAAANDDATNRLKTSKMFVRFLRHIWLDSIYVACPWAEKLFLPKFFFSKEDEISWFEQAEAAA